jgi:hypothetical protein
MQPGTKKYIDQYISGLPGRLTHTRGREDKKTQYNGGTLFVDHCSGYIHHKNQVSLRIGETLKANTILSVLPNNSISNSKQRLQTKTRN